tara:strand:+ start:148 stop:612 length:465 start_codon:yes stop_codon:yes gene_type:complete
MINIRRYTIFIFGIILAVFITSCSNKKIITMDKDIRRVDVVDHNGYMIKTYYEKYSQNYNGWLKANCKKNKSNILSCDFTSNSLILINNSKSDNNNNNKKSINNNSQQNEQNLEQQQQELEQQQQELEQQQQELEQQEQENLNEQEFLRCEENC